MKAMYQKVFEEGYAVVKKFRKHRKMRLSNAQDLLPMRI